MGQPLGQHFLNDPSVARFMVDSADVSGKTVLEVGPGKGMITRYLVRSAERVIVVEKDRSFERFLEDLPVEIIWGDVLEVDLPDVDWIVSNLPFCISSPFIFSMPPVPAVLGLQKEFAERMVAEPGTSDYGRLSVSAQIRYHVELLKTYPSSVFTPEPKVDLGIVRLRPNDPAAWLRSRDFIRRVFAYPNKNLDNALELAGYDPVGSDKKVREVGTKEVLQLTEESTR